MRKMEKGIGLVLSGGGARGAYQIGIWQAMKEVGLEQKISHVYGTSVGAINGAAFIQGDFELSKEIWNALDYSNIFSDVSLSSSRKKTRKYFYSLARAVVRDKGLSVDPLKKILRGHLNEAIIRASPKQFGIVVYDLKRRMPRYLLKSEIPEGQLIEYVIASATFPLFQPHRIEGGLFIDGGVYDNRPLDFVFDDAAISSVYCVDVTIARHFWPRKRVKRPLEIKYLRPSRLLGSPLAFRTDRIEKNMRLGYADGIAQLGPVDPEY